MSIVECADREKHFTLNTYISVSAETTESVFHDLQLVLPTRSMEMDACLHRMT